MEPSDRSACAGAWYQRLGGRPWLSVRQLKQAVKDAPFKELPEDHAVTVVVEVGTARQFVRAKSARYDTHHVTGERVLVIEALEP